jgi:hypothetical protein
MASSSLIPRERRSRGHRLSDALPELPPRDTSPDLTSERLHVVHNAGGEGSIVVEKIRGLKDKNFGDNAFTDTYEELGSDRRREGEDKPAPAAPA